MGGPESKGGGNAVPVLRPYQTDAIAAIEREHSAGRKRTLLVLPTGTGKTVVFAELARRSVAAGGRALVVAHRTELLKQAAAKLAAVGVRSSLDKGADRASLGASVVIGSVQTLRGARLERYAVDAFTDVFVDEAHHTAAASYLAILSRFPNARVLGVTATPDRGDGRALGKIYESVAYAYEMRAAIRDGFLAPLRARRVIVADLDLANLKTHHGDFDQGELAAIMAEEKALHGVVAPLVQQAGDRKTLVFGVDVAHAHALAEVINRHRPASAIALDGGASEAERAAALALFSRGTFQFLVNCALFTEGFDEPSIACVAMARPTQSRALYTQMVGRGTRLAPGKADLLVLDFVGNSGRHRLIGPADALAGVTLDDAARDAAEALLDGQLELEDVLAMAEAESAARRQRAGLVALVHYRQKEVDPFLGDLVPPMDPDSPRAREPATSKQLAAIVDAGFGKPPAGMTVVEASQILDAIAQRRKTGLATIPQCRLLEQMNVDTRMMTLPRAGQLIQIMRNRGFKPWTLQHEPEYRRTARKA